MNQELNIKIQVEAETPNEFLLAYAESLDSISRYLRDRQELSAKMPRSFKLRGDGIRAQCEIQATGSYIDAIERQYQNELKKIEASIASPNTDPGDIPQLKKLAEDIKAMLEGITQGDDDEGIVRIGSK